MKFVDYDRPPRGSRGVCVQCGFAGLVVYDIQVDQFFCSPECHDTYRKAPAGAVIKPAITEAKLT